MQEQKKKPWAFLKSAGNISADESEKNTRKKLIAELIKTSTLVLCAFFTIVFGTAAWFVSNTKVDSSGIAISHQYETIKLATKGVRQTAEEKLLNLNVGTAYKYGDPPATYYVTEDKEIALRLNSNDISVRPGFSGEITFYIIPQYTGTLEATLYLELAGYQEYTENAVTTAKRVKDDVLDALLDGHILLFRNKDYSDLLWTENGSILHLSESAQKGVPLPVTFYWYWPLRYEDMQETWLDRTLTKPLPNAPNYRYNRVFIAKADGDIPQRLTDAKLCDEAYNRADEYIGSHADFLYLSIQTSLEEEPTP